MKLVADIGGTHARFARLNERGEPMHIQNLKTADFSDLASAIRAYLKTERIESAVISIAAPLAGDRVRMTNASWDFSIEQTKVELGLQSLRLINDFEALALAVPTLTASELQAIGHTLPLDTVRTKAIIGPGTGLGMAGVIPVFTQGQISWHAIPCEGGHASIAPSNERDAALLKAAWELGLQHVCWEDFLSGTGLPLLYQCVCHSHGYEFEPMTPAQITNGALRTGDEPCLATLLIFCELLGSAAGDLALMAGARGGVYIKGGVLDRVLELDPHFLTASHFRQCFDAKGAYSGYMHSIPTWFIKTEQLALRGCAAAF
jgi:glucokinase